MKRVRPRARTINVRRLSRRELERGLREYPEPAVRPKCRAECRGGPRPCPFVGCRYNLFLDVAEANGSIKINFPDLEPCELGESCALDVADRGGATLEEVGELMNLTRERLRQLESAAFVQLGALPQIEAHRGELGQ